MTSLRPSLAARRLLMSSYLYYRRDSQVLVDRDYDKLAPIVAAHWKSLGPLLQWQLESPEAILATGHHVRITVQTESAAVAWYRKVRGCPPGGDAIHPDDWKAHPEFGRWVYAET